MSLPPAENYFREPTASTILYIHIGFMTLAWVGALPILASLTIARSNLARYARILLLSLHALGTVFGVAYNSKTPDLYQKSSHHSLAWVLSAIALLETISSIVRRFWRDPSPKPTFDARSESDPLVQSSGSFQDSEESLDDNQIHRSGENYLPSLRGHRRNRTNSMSANSHSPYDFAFFSSRATTNGRHKWPFPWTKRWPKPKMISPRRFIPSTSFTSTFFVIVMITLAFTAFCTGIVTMAGIFHGNHIFNGLAHFIKGGVFFFFGVITSLRCAGCFSGFGWAWNLKASTYSPSRKWSRSITMEGLECSLIFIYGVTNVFLEHLSGWGKAWTARDLEHVAITLLFIGGGLCGMMVESRASWTLSNKRTPEDSLTLTEKQVLIPGYSTNPIPALIIFLLGTILGGHHQGSTESTMMHKWFGNFLTAASITRSLTYVLLYIAPAKSQSPTRPPSEFITSFCLMAGGLTLMASNEDTIDAMIEHDLNAMEVTTVTLGITAVVMAWCLALVAVKEWAQRREDAKTVGKIWSQSEFTAA
ncbi:hypothetical protein B0A52_01273 [Exophiala mesophila]|uniref:Protein YTP1-like C-terminal domain-containing protein n=1 Tax=Exophiala mesophila TaxID=212818 RepID=A0A438NH04_EXOME|nr:hypothetical protein B0A52_01273 [Exophiala mesophila]